MARLKKGKAKERLDKYYRLAKEQGLRARSAFKLVQLNRKFGFLQKARALLDLGAAPGGWLQIAQKTMTIASTIVGVDLMPIRPIPGVKTIVGDFLTENVRRNIKSTLSNRKVDVVLHDGAPNVSGAWDKDAYVQNVLVLAACKLACDFLAKGGTFVTKVFRSSDYPKLMFVLKELFEKAHATKPESSRFTSAEIFVVCIGFKAPRSIDPKFFNPRDVFADLTPEKPTKKDQSMLKLTKLLDPKRKKKKPTGYEADGLLLFKRISATDFLESDTPEQIVQTYNEITFDPDGSEDRFLHSPHTNVLVTEACKDLKSQGLFTIKKLLQWHKRVRRDEHTRRAFQRGVAPDAEVELDERSDGEKDIEQLEGELAELRKREERAVKTARKKLIAKKLKQAVFGYNKNDNPNDTTGGDEAIFDLPDDKADLEQKLLQVTEKDFDAHFDAGAGMLSVTRFGDVHRTKQLGEDNAGIDPFEAEVGEEEESGEEASGDDEGAPEEEEEAEPEDGRDRDFYERLEWVARKKAAKRRRGDRKERALEGDVAEVPGEHLEDDDLEDAAGEPDLVDPVAPAEKEEAIDSSSSSDESESGSEGGGKKRKRRKTRALDRKDNKVAASGFEQLPASLRDPLLRAKMHAMATKMLDKREKRQLLEAAVNRWCFNDDDLPEWFVEDERRACFRLLPVTREEVEQQKARFRALNAMPSKKVMQAIHRKRMKAKRILSKLVEKDKANPLRNKKELPSVRKLMRSNKLDTRKIKKKQEKVDGRLRGERYREWTKKKKAGLVRGRGGKKKK